MNKFLAATICLFVPIVLSAAYKTDEVINDITLIYQGGTHRPDWTESELTPYVTHTFADGHTDWFFSEFLFYEFTNNWQVGYGYKYGTRNAKRADWEWLLGRIFEKGKSLDALNSCIEHNKATLGEPKAKHKIVLGVVSPITDQTDWGELNGEKLNFSVQADQIKAAKWYIDQLVSRFNAEGYENLELVGFYWLEETTAKCGNLPKYLAEYIHSMPGMKFYWIPYWDAPGYNNWKELGFDTAFLQPNHFFDTDIPDNRLRNACQTAKLYNMALELEFDYRALYEYDDSYYSRLETYINAFETNNVFANSAIAYYSGTKAILEMYESTVPENTEIIDRIANHIIERRNAKDAVDKVSVNDAGFTLIGGNGELTIGSDNRNIYVYDAIGRIVSVGKSHIECAPGVYYVKVDGATKSVIVK